MRCFYTNAPHYCAVGLNAQKKQQRHYQINCFFLQWSVNNLIETVPNKFQTWIVGEHVNIAGWSWILENSQQRWWASTLSGEQKRCREYCKTNCFLREAPIEKTVKGATPVPCLAQIFEDPKAQRNCTIKMLYHHIFKGNLNFMVLFSHQENQENQLRPLQTIYVYQG